MFLRAVRREGAAMRWRGTYGASGLQLIERAGHDVCVVRGGLLGEIGWYEEEERSVLVVGENEKGLQWRGGGALSAAVDPSKAWMPTSSQWRRGQKKNKRMIGPSQAIASLSSLDVKA
jgi:hypothetical protein